MENEKVIANKEKFLALSREYIHRDGLEGLLKYLEESDFFEAPASTIYHGSYKGGLCEHSLDVFEQAKRLVEAGFVQCDMESLAIATLFHDVCKVNVYGVEYRNKKINGSWESVPVYVFDEKDAFGGHGSKSVYLVQRYMPLSFDEATAINCHMGFTGVTDIRPIANAYAASPLAWLVHVADEAATYVLNR